MVRRAMFLFEPVIRPFEDPGRGLPGDPGVVSAQGRSAFPGSSTVSAAGCGPSPSLMSQPPLQPRRRPDSLLARMARKRQVGSLPCRPVSLMVSVLVQRLGLQ
jgi:hypothetical protein